MFKPSLLAASIAACSSLSVYAADTTLSPQIVTASRISQSVDSTLASVQVIDREVLEAHQGQDLGDVLRATVSGVEVIRTGGLGQQTSIFTRGTNSNHTLVLIDGVRINSATSAQANIQNLSLSDVERIEVVKGPMSVLYGSDAIGGVINIITRNPAKTQTTLTTNVGNQKLVSGSIQQTIKQGALSALVDASGLYSDGYAFIEHNPTKRGYQNQSGNIKANYDLDSTRLEFQARHNQGTAEYLDFFGSPLSQDFLNQLLLVGISSDLSATFNTQLRLSQMKDEINQNQNANRAQTTRLQTDWQNTWQWQNNQTLVAGSTLEQVKTQYNTSYDKQLNNWAVYGQNQSQYGQLSTQIALRHDHHDTFGNHQTGNLALGYALNPQNRIYVNAGSAFRAPDFNNLYGYGGNPDLKPEKSTAYELGSEHKINQLTIHSAIFHNNIKELIVFNNSFTQLINLSEVRTEGAELSLKWQAAQWYVGTDGSYIKAQDPKTDTDLMRRPRRGLGLTAGYQQDNWGLNIDSLSKSHAFDYSGNIAGYNVWNANLYWQASSNLKLRLIGENLTNKTYGVANANNDTRYLAKPRTVVLSASVNF